MIDHITYLNDVLDRIDRPRNLQYGVLIRSVFNGKTYVHLDDTTHTNEQWALDEAMLHSTNDLTGLFEIDMATANMKQIMNAAELVDYCEQRREDEMSDAEQKETAFLSRVDDLIKERG
jgi:hypothetical protein